MWRVKNKAMNKWRNFVKESRNVESGEAEWDEVYDKKILKKYFGNWVYYHFNKSFSFNRKIFMRRSQDLQRIPGNF